MRLLLFVLLALWLPLAAAQDQPPALTDWQAHCTLPGGQAFGLRFHTDSPDPTNDDMQVMLVLAGGKQVKLGLPPAWYLPVTLTGNADNRCDSIVATPAGDGRILLWLATDDRPNFPQLTLALVDLKSGQLVAKRTTLGAIKISDENVHLAIRHHDTGYEVRVVHDVLTNTHDDTAYNYIEDWLQVGVGTQTIDTRWR
nr:hypothetical protein [Dyella sp. ASV24]